MDYIQDFGRKMPDRYRYQTNGKTAQENYRELKRIQLRKAKKKETLESFVIALLQATLRESLTEIMKEILPKR